MATNSADGDLLAALVERQLLTQAQASALTAAAAERGSSVVDVLVQQGTVNEEELTRVRAEVSQLPYVDLTAVTISREVLGIIPESTAREHLVVAYEQTAAELKLAMANPTDRQIVEFIHKKVDVPVTVALASRRSVLFALQQYQQTLERELADILPALTAPAVVEEDLSRAAENVPVVRICDLVFKHAILQGASDIHIEPTEDNVIVRYRLDGLLHDMLTLPKHVSAGLIARIKVLSRLKIDEHRLPQDGRFKIENEQYNVAFRVSVLPVFDGEKVVMRLLDESGHGLGLDSIGLRPKPLDVFRRNIAKPHGMVLVTGPTGSGKTTTLYAAMKEINSPEVNISTIEDPIEYRMPRINQTQVNPKIGLNFSNGLRSLVRQDPDIIMVGEIRDEETASLAVNAALTGHLLLSTLHTNSAAGALPRLLDMHVESFLVASTTNLLVAQRLVRRLCAECRKPGKLSKEQLEDLAKDFDMDSMLATLQREGAVGSDMTWAELPVFEPQGCRVCNGGYKGRVGVYEVLEMTDSIRALITTTISSQQLEEAARKEQHMVTMLEDGFIKVTEGVTTIAEVLRVSTE